MTLKESLAQKRLIPSTVFFHSSIVVSSYFVEVCDCISEKQNQYKVFFTCMTELDDYTLFKQKEISENALTLKKLISTGTVAVSQYSEYDLSIFNPQVSTKGQSTVVIFGNKKAFSDFTVHCPSNESIYVILLEKINDQYLIADSNAIRKNLLSYEYKARWNDSVYSYSDDISTGVVLYYGEKNTKFILGEPVSALTGEGEVYKTSIRGALCKIYKKGVLQKGLTEKLMYVIGCPKMTERAAWPREIVYNRIGQPIGFLMQQFDGTPLSNLIYQWTDRDWLRNVCKAGALISQSIFMFHAQNIIVGDISPRDILFNRKMEICFIDADSFQYNTYPCPGFMYEYKHKDLDPRFIKKVLRPFVFEYFSLAVVLYEMMMRGHYPNEIKQNLDEITFGDESSSDNSMFNYKTMKFPFTVNGHTNKATESATKCWEQIPERLQKLFVDVFSYNRIVSASEWQIAFTEELNKI